MFYFVYNILGIPVAQEMYCHECEVAKQKEIFYKKELKCLQEAIYFESRSLNDRGKAMVAQAILNRSKSSVGRNTVCDTVYVPSIVKDYYRKCAFSFACDRKTERMREPKAAAKALKVAKNALNGKYKSLTKATHFLHCEVARGQSWVRNMKPAGTDGIHCFYY